MDYLCFILAGYLSGSVLYGYLIPKLFCHVDVTEKGEDRNPGAANAFLAAGIPVGILVLVLELAKGALPVWMAARVLNQRNWLFGLVMAAPVLGHAFPVWRKGKGGKAIAVSFGVLLGLWPARTPIYTLVFFYLLFSLVIVIRPHFYRSVITFALFMAVCADSLENPVWVFGCVLISLTVIWKHLCRYHGEKLSVRLGWLRDRKARKEAAEK